MSFRPVALTVTLLMLVFATGLWAKVAAKTPAALQLAAVALPFGQPADWQQWDSFLTFVVKRLAQDLDAGQKERLGEVFIDARYQVAGALRLGSADPVPSLFLDTWERLSPIVKQSIPVLAQQSASQYTSFITAMDGVASVGGIGQQLGLLRITPDALRGAASLLGTTSVDPLSYTGDIDNALRSLLGFTASLPTPRISPALEQSRLRGLPLIGDRSLGALKQWFIRPAHAAEDDFSKLNQWVPDMPELQEYLIEVRRLLTETSDKVVSNSQLPPEYRQLYRQLVLTTGWQESCWRQFVKKGRKLTTLSSSTGDVGLMQVNRVTWRNLYDAKGLAGDIGYNGQAGAEILQHYLTRYAIPKKEDKQKDGHLARATYSAYNGGPRHLGRYRAAKQVPALKQVDEAFYRKFQAVSSGQELAVRSCYGP